MLELHSPLGQTLLGTLFTWGMTALGSFGCLLHYSAIESRKLLDASLGFSAGVMLAASYWSLLAPAQEMAHHDGYGNLSFIPLAVGLLTGSYFVFLADKYVPVGSFCHSDLSCPPRRPPSPHESPCADATSASKQQRSQHHNSSNNRQHITNQLIHRRPQHANVNSNNESPVVTAPANANVVSRRLLLMMIAITMHNIPEGLAVGVAFGAVGKSTTATAHRARNLALGIGIQNFPEGLAVSLPLKAAGMSLSRSVWYGQLSGLVEPVAGVIGCLAVQMISPLLPYALSFAAGAMIFVVFDDMVPEAQAMGNGKLASISAIFGFVLMMGLDIGLG